MCLFPNIVLHVPPISSTVQEKLDIYVKINVKFRIINSQDCNLMCLLSICKGYCDLVKEGVSVCNKLQSKNHMKDRFSRNPPGSNYILLTC